MQKRSKSSILIVVLFLAVASGVAAWWSYRTPWHRAGTEERVGNPTNDSFWEGATKPPESKRPDLPRNFEEITSERIDDEIWIRRENYEGPRYHGGELGVEPVFAEAGVAKLPGGTDLSLAGAVLFVPGHTTDIRFFDPSTGATLTEEQLSEYPESAKKFQPNAMISSPTLRLIFRGPAAALVRDPISYVFDARTQWLVAHGGPIEFGDEFVVSDVRLSLWHDTPLDVVIDVPCGKPETAAIPRELGTQFKVADSIRIQVGALGAGRAKAVGGRGEIFDVVGDVENEGFVVARLSPSIWAQQCQVGLEGQTIAERTWLEAIPRFQAAKVSQPIDKVAADDLRVFWFPDRARIWFRIESLRDMPNKRSVGNLFDVKIPQVEVSDRAGFEAMLLLAGRATQHDVLSQGVYWNYGVGDPPPEGYFPRKWKNVKASQLLRELLRFHKDGQVRIDRAEQYLIYEEREKSTWWEDTKTWVKEKWPF
ncbi:MAG: hypothetical protein AAF585_08810 [Verrucomicrobiota bacterium]